MKGGYKSKSEQRSVPAAIPTNAGVDTDHGAAKLAAHAQKDQSYTQANFMNGFSFNPDRKNVAQATPGGGADGKQQTGGLMDGGSHNSEGNKGV